MSATTTHEINITGDNEPLGKKLTKILNEREGRYEGSIDELKALMRLDCSQTGFHNRLTRQRKELLRWGICFYFRDFNAKVIIFFESEGDEQIE